MKERSRVQPSTRGGLDGSTMETMHTITPTRVAEPGCSLDLMVLADGPEGCAAVDVASGAFVRAGYQGRAQRPFSPFEVVRAVVAEDPDGPDPTQPEAVTLSEPPAVVGRLRGRRVRRLLGPLTLPPGAEPFGFPGSAAPYWTVPGDRPSLAIIRPQDGPQLMRRGTDHFACRFGWRGVEMELPLVDRRARRAAAATEAPWLAGGHLARTLGFIPSHLVLALTTPRQGRCYKVVTGFLPKP